MRIALETHGCRLNQAEGDAIAAFLASEGHELVTTVEQAELLVLNTCTITHEADRDAYAAIRRAGRSNAELRVLVTGCLAVAEPDALARVPGVAAVIGNLEKQRPESLRAAIEQALGRAGDRPRQRSGDSDRPEAQGLIAVEQLTRRVRPSTWSLTAARAPERTRPLLKVQDGCDLQCSFCIVPRVRGRSRSLALADVATQLAELHAAGHAEVVLTGAHLGLWGRDLADAPTSSGQRRPSRLGELVAGLLVAQPDARLRLGSVDPHEVGDDLIELLARGVDPHTGAGLCRHLHLPIQSGDDGVLRAMRRAHDVADLERLVPRLRHAAPEIAIGTDVIVGFPGEDEQAFEHTYALFEQLRIPFAHVFTWSPRSGTAASELPDRVAPELARARSTRLRGLVDRNWREFMREQVGHVLPAVIMRRRDRQGELVALTDNYTSARLIGPDSLLGRRTLVEVVQTDAGRARGRVAA